jgi:hypothetical protein
MQIELIIQDSKSGNAWDMSELVNSGINWETNIAEQPGKLTFEYIDQENISINEGSPVSFKIDGQGIFFGYVFKKGRSKNGKIPITAYDQMRYLKNKDTYVFSGLTASEIFLRITSDFKLKAEVVDASTYVVAPRVHDNKTLFEAIQYGIDETLINTGNWYMLRDNFGKLQFININTLKTDLFIGDESLLVDYDFSSSIDDDSYNQIKLIKENQETQKREIYIVKDSSTIKQWGLLQYFEKMDENANAAQIQARADMLLKLKNRATKKLKLAALGDLRVFAGTGIVLGISDLEKEGIAANQYFMVTQCSHSFSNDMHIMQLELQVSI